MVRMTRAPAVSWWQRWRQPEHGVGTCMTLCSCSFIPDGLSPSEPGW